MPAQHFGDFAVLRSSVKDVNEGFVCNAHAPSTAVNNPLQSERRVAVCVLGSASAERVRGQRRLYASRSRNVSEYAVDMSVDPWRRCRYRCRRWWMRLRFGDIGSALDQCSLRRLGVHSGQRQQWMGESTSARVGRGRCGSSDALGVDWSARYTASALTGHVCGVASGKSDRLSSSEDFTRTKRIKNMSLEQTERNCFRVNDRSEARLRRYHKRTILIVGRSRSRGIQK